MYPGDPLTPGLPSVPGTPRLQPDQAQNLSHTPTTPISYREAEPLLRALGGPAAPDDFQAAWASSTTWAQDRRAST